MNNFLDQFTFSPMDCLFQAKEALLLPRYKGGTFRGAFGYAFKKALCTARNVSDCKECILQKSCVYAYIFETPQHEKASVIRKYDHIPHPFAFCPPLDQRRNIAPDTQLTCRIVLIGRAIEYLPYFVLVLETMGEQGLGKFRGKCSLEAVQNHSRQLYQRGDTEVASPNPMTAKSAFSQMKNPPDSFELELLTPLKLIREHKLLRECFGFQDLFRALIRRIMLLGQLHCGLEPDVDLRSLIEAAGDIETLEDQTSWYDWSRFSTRQKKTMPGGGFVGKISFRGNLEPFWPYLLFGQYVHVGKNTSFGLGRYTLNPKDNQDV